VTSWKSSPEILLAPSASCGAVLKLPGHDRDARAQTPGRPSLPRVDDHLARPETRQEIVRGERLFAQPALAPHGDRHFGLDYVLGAHVGSGFIGSTDLLTRAAHDSDFATDTCIRKAGDDPETGQRYLEEVAFEVVNEQSLKQITERAEDLCRRGVRRVFAIFVKTGTVKEWAPRKSTWVALAPEGAISDPCLTRPLTVRALVDAAAADDEVARALEAKGNPAILVMKAASEHRGAQREAALAVLAVLSARELDVPARVRATIEASTDLEALRHWLARAITAATAAEVIGEVAR
jgi:hypothetical protein